MQSRLKMITAASITLIALLLSFQAASAHTPSPYGNPDKEGLSSSEKPRELKDIGIEEKLGTKVDLGLTVNNEQGQPVLLSTYFSSNKPVIFSLVYYSCPGLCNFHLNGLFEGLKNVDWNPGRDFEVVALSFDHRENAEMAAEKKKNYIEMYGRGSVVESGIHFLTASEDTIQKIASQVGFKYKWNNEANEWAHASAAIVVSPEGKISRYLHGIMFDAKDIRLALTEGGQGKIGTFVDQMIWYCFKYDPKKSKYTLYAFRLVQAGGLLMVLVLAALVIPNWVRSRRLNLSVKRP